MVTRLLLIFLCLSVLSTVTGCSVEPTAYGTPSSGGEGEKQMTRRGNTGNNGGGRMRCIIRGTALLVSMPQTGR